MKQKLHKCNLLAAIVAMLLAMVALPTQTLAQETNYDVVLEDVGSSKLDVIKAVREITGLGLADTKTLVETAPCIVLENAAKDDAQTACDKLTAAGATAAIYPTGTWPPAVEYDLRIGGKPVTSANCGDLSVIPGVSGTAKYDNATKTLTLDNATITTFDTAINSDISGLVVNVTGVNNIRANNTGVFSSAPMTIKGDGTLEAESGTTAAIYSYKTSMLIEGCTVVAKGATKGITGKGGNGGEDLTIRNATVKAVGSKGSICGLASVTLEDCGIAQPAGAAFDESLNGVALGGALVTDTVVIKPTDSGFYDVVLEDYGSSKLDVIKAVREITGLGLSDSKTLVERAPCIVLANATKYTAQTACDKLTAAGATANIYPTGTWPPAEKYGLRIAGEYVTSANCGDLSEIPGVSGTVTYDNATKTLTLDNATITTTSRPGIDNGISGLVINVTGVNSVSSDYVGVFSNKPMTIKGNGTLEAKSGTSAAVYSYLTSLLIEECTVIANGAYGIAGKDGQTGETLTIRNASVKAAGSKGSICDFATVTLEGCGITQPEGAAFDASLKGVALGGALVTDKVVIERPAVEYDLRIGGKPVTSANCGDLSAIPGVSGTVTYDNATKTLTLDNATITVTSGPGFENNISGLVINVTGTNNISANNTGVFSYKPMTIKGNGTLEAKSKNAAAIYSYETSLLIEECTVIANGAHGITGKAGLTGEKLTIRHASVTAAGSSGSICDFASVVLNGCGIVQPEGAAFDASLKGVALGGALVKDTVVIEPTVMEYGLRIAGQPVTSANCGDLSVIPGVSGTVTYDNATKTLTLDNATITTSGIAISNGTSGLVVNVTGVNSFSTQASGVVSTTPMSIKGDGTLVAKSSSMAALYAYQTLLIEGCTVIAKGAYGIAGKGEKLTIRNATVMATGSSGSISNFASVVLNGCGIVQPAGAAFDASLKGVALGGALVTDKVVIEPTEYDFYDAVLEDYGSSKLDVIKAVREITGLGLADAKDLVDSAPCIVLERVTKADAQTACDKLTAVGAIANVYPTGTCDGIAKVSSDSKQPGKQGIYTLQGVKMDCNWHDGKLPKGIYIVDGVKKIKK